MKAVELIIGILTKEGAEYLSAFPYVELIDATARGVSPDPIVPGKPVGIFTGDENRFARKLTARL